MPIYEYQCDACHHRLEAIQKLSDAPLTDCPACAQPALRKLVSAAGFRLSGSGWYETDFKNKNQRNLKESAGANPASKETPPKAEGAKASPAAPASSTTTASGTPPAAS
ncbi:FmdB family zinc ribbon protein [Thiorhodospira sibirica]|uniref:FmdB family zinc ribbon protein n=1 Tax=Thiorhodospira sibirica TaxID=154347 RepID=UPI00022C4050|nr:zinc ribbon domain-containing protein [Thiorhodospira sibirica]